MTRAWTAPVRQVDAGQQADRPVALILMIAREGRLRTGLGRQIRGGGGDRLDARFLVIGDDRHRVARLLLRCGRGLFNDLDLAVDAQNSRHLDFELGVAAFQVVAHLVRLDLLLIEYLAQSALNQLAKAGVPFGWSMLARVTSQKPRRPQFVRIAQVLRLAAGQRDQPCPGLGRDRRLLARPGTIVERRHCTIGQRPLNAALDRLMMHPQSSTHRKERRVFPVSQQHSRSLDPARRLRSRACYRNKPRQILFSNRQLNRSSPRRHDLRISSRESKKAAYRPAKTK